MSKPKAVLQTPLIDVDKPLKFRKELKKGNFAGAFNILNVYPLTTTISSDGSFAKK